MLLLFCLFFSIVFIMLSCYTNQYTILALYHFYSKRRHIIMKQIQKGGNIT